MAKVTNQFDVAGIMATFSRFAPFALIVCALLSFIAVGVFCVDFYEELFSKRFKSHAHNMAIMVAVIQELVRFSLLISSVRDFSDNKKGNGWLGLIASAGLVMHDIYVAYDIAEMWSKSKPELYSGVFIFLIVIGLILEIRLVLTVDNASLGKPKASNNQNGVPRNQRNGNYQTA